MATTLEDAYKVLGVNRTASLQQVRARYYELAKIHHPDKLQNISDEEKQRHEDIFKGITVAYSKIECDKKLEANTSYNVNGSMPDISNTPIHPDEWRTVWNEMESIFNKPGIWNTMKDIVKDTLKDVAVKGLQKLANRHHVKIPVTLEEVHAKKQKKVRLFLTNIHDPVYIIIDTGDYPLVELAHSICIDGITTIITIVAELTLLPHAVYTFDDLLESWDLFTTVRVTWIDYIQGKTLELPYIDSSSIHVDIVPFTHYIAPITFSERGLCGLGDLYVSVELQPPDCTHTIWDDITPEKKQICIESLRCMYKL